MVKIERCSNTNSHYFHTHKVKAQETCNGYTACGILTHDPHLFEAERERWCPGVCHCGMKHHGIHGPGAHK